MRDVTSNENIRNKWNARRVEASVEVGVLEKIKWVYCRYKPKSRVEVWA